MFSVVLSGDATLDSFSSGIFVGVPTLATSLSGSSLFFDCESRVDSRVVAPPSLLFLDWVCRDGEANSESIGDSLIVAPPLLLLLDWVCRDGESNSGYTDDSQIVAPPSLLLLDRLHRDGE